MFATPPLTISSKTRDYSGPNVRMQGTMTLKRSTAMLRKDVKVARRAHHRMRHSILAPDPFPLLKSPAIGHFEEVECVRSRQHSASNATGKSGPSK